ncbi:hypothetical protein VNI00_009047 [Paramarasmius palmivorus]|uniref:Peptidase S1 domain-containing protein n=1 Tax=Paramarasmius palmivorus TaxID=297713 RepID=A0AAW0CSF1_9AGAR
MISSAKILQTPTSHPSYFNLRSDVADKLEIYVKTQEFNEECAVYSRGFSKRSDGDNNSDYYCDHSLWDTSDSSNISESSPYDVSKLEAHLYFAGVRGPNRHGPKLIFRTSKDVFEPPTGPEAYRRLMQLRPVYEHPKLGKDNLWEFIRSEVRDLRNARRSWIDIHFKVVKLLDQRDIRHSSVDLVRFSWLEKNKDNRDDDETLYITPVTVWVGVLPDTLTGEVAFHSSNDILGLLNEHGIADVEVSYRESVYRPSSGPELFAPVSDLDPLKAVIDPLTTALGLPIAGLKTLKMQGTMGFYFRVGTELYAVTARHVLFPEDERNDEYIYKSGPKKEVVLMGTRAFNNFLKKIQAHIGTLNNTAYILEQRVKILSARSQDGGLNAQQTASELEETRREQVKTQAAIGELKKFFVKVNKEWTKPADRVIGHVVWAPPISVNPAPHGYTKDVCVVKLDKQKFCKNFKGNTLDLGACQIILLRASKPIVYIPGPEIDAAKFIDLMYPRTNTASDFKYPDERLLKLRAILSKEEIRNAANKDHKDDPACYVIKRGLATLTTIGCLSGFNSHCRRYFPDGGKRDSVEAAIHHYDNETGSFSRGGDSGSIVVDACGKFVALLTGGTGPTDSPDITFGTPMHWLWEVIKAQFEGADLYFDDN